MRWGSGGGWRNSLRDGLRNEAIWGGNRLIPRSRIGIVLGVWGRRFGLEALELVERVAVVALGHVDAALEAGEFIALLGVGLAKGNVEDVERFFPELGLDGAEAAEEPLAIDQGIDEHALLGGSGTESSVIFAGEFFESCESFAADELRLGVDAGFECVHGGPRLALDGARSRGFECVEAVGLKLLLGCHKTKG